MSKVRIPVVGTVGKSVRIDPDATEGATLGENVFDEDGNLLTTASLAALLAPGVIAVAEEDEDTNRAIFETEIIDGTLLARVADPEIISGAWTHTDDITMANGIAVNWQNSSDVDIEFLNVVSVGTGAAMDFYQNAATVHSTTTSATYVDVVNGAQISQAAMTVGDDYLVLHQAIISGLGGVGAYKLIASGATLAGSITTFTAVNTSTSNPDGSPYGYVGWFTADGGADFKAQHHRQVGTSTTEALSQSFLLNLTTDCPNHVKDQSVATTSIAPGPTWTSTDVAVTLPAGDWLLFVSGQIDFNTSTWPEMGINDGTTDFSLMGRSRTGSTDQHTNAAMFYLDDYAGGTVTVIGKAEPAFNVNMDYKCIVAIPLSDFAEAYAIQDVTQTPVVMSARNVDEVATTLSVPSIVGTSSDWFAFGFGSHNWVGSDPSIGFELLSNVNAGGDTKIGWDNDRNHRISNTSGPDATEGQAIMSDSTISLTAGDAVDIKLNVVCTEATFASHEYSNEGAALVRLAQPADETFIVGDPAYPTRIDGLTTNITSAATVIEGTLNAQGAVDFDTTLNVDGATTLAGTLNAQGAVDFDTTLNVDGAVTFVATLNAQGAVDFDATLNVDGVASFQDDVTLSAASAINFVTDEVAAYTEAVAEVPGAASGDDHWPSVSLLANFDGADAATSYTSEDDGLRVATFVADAQLDTAQKKFGTASLLLDGTGDYLTFPDHADWELGTGDFTLECNVRYNGDPGSGGRMAMFGQFDADGVSERSWRLGLYDNLLRLGSSTDGIATTVTSVTWDPAGDTWYHVACTRFGTDLRFFVDGVQVGATQTLSEDFFVAASPLFVGAHSSGTGVKEFTDGWIDNIRITKGQARYTTTFQPSTGAYAAEDSYWSDTALQLDFAGVDAATVTTDLADPTRVATFNGTAAIDTAQSKFGGTSLVLDGNSDYLTFPDSADWHFAAGDFTVECWAMLNDASNIEYYVCQYDSSVNEASWAFGYDGVAGVMKFLTSTDGLGGGVTTLSSSAYTPSTGVWIHFAACRVGGNLRMYADGVEYYNAANTTNLFNSASVLYVGALHGGASVIHHQDGWMDDVRITKGVGRYPTAFTPPDETHPSEDADYNAVSLLANCDGADAATTYTSEDGGLRTATFGNGAALDTAQSKFGTASMLFVRSNEDSVSFPDSADYDFGSGEFTVEFHVRHASAGAASLHYYMGHYDKTTNDASWSVRWQETDNKIAVIHSSDGSTVNTVTSTSTWTPTVGVWYHIAISRNADTLNIYVDGVSINSSAFTTDLYEASTPFDIGLVTGSGGDTHWFDGWMDNVRVTKGVGRYPAAFTPPVAPYLTLPPAGADPVAAVPAIYTVGDPLVDTVIDGLETNITSASLVIDGAISVNVTTVITTSHTAADEHVILVDDDTAAATVTVTLPAAATAKTMYHIKKLGTTASVIIDADGTETIDGALTATLNTQYESIMLVSDGSNWHVI